jgi:hypothetical protein
MVPGQQVTINSTKGAKIHCIDIDTSCNYHHIMYISCVKTLKVIEVISYVDIRRSEVVRLPGR